MALNETTLAPRKWLYRYKFYFIIGFFVILLQVFLAYKSFDITVSETKSLPITNSNLNNFAKNAIKSDKSRLRSNAIYDELDFVPSCNITVRDALSALDRAKTQQCKKKIADIACAIQSGKFYPKVLPSFCPTNNFTANRSIGCFKDEKTFRILSGYYTNFKTSNSHQKCLQMCLQSGFIYAGVQYQTECFCGNNQPSYLTKLPDPSCNMKCPGNPKEICGGYFTMNVFETGISKFKAQVAELSPESSSDDVKIAYLLTFNGRAVRQVYRLLKALYSPRHVYYIHIDSRQDYMYRSLIHLETDFPNIKLARNRFSTIWGGASLLKMLLSSMETLLNSTWSWDFVINLSESDFPIKTNDKLVKFLTANRDKNFVKSHGREVQRFIQKQGLDKTFVECDTHMWRIGERELPTGIQIDGGSDWVGLSKKFVLYIIQHKDILIDGLLTIFHQTLLPAESFFHTVLRNSIFCDSYIDSNLHITNWKRRLGCKCQYKHVVDWCGCSPNDFKPNDWPRIKASEFKQIFFARKFEPVVNQAIIQRLEEWMYGPYPAETKNLKSYWESFYHFMDKRKSSSEDAILTVATSLVRINNLENLRKSPSKIIEVLTYMEDDEYNGFLIIHETESIKYETWIEIIHTETSSNSCDLAKRIDSIDVSTDYDPKEQMYRNFAKIIGPTSEPVLVFKLSKTKIVNQTNYNVTILWMNPIGQLVDSTESNIDDSSTENIIHYAKLDYKHSMTPGEWTVKIIYKNNIIGECKFLVTPLEFITKERITEEKSKEINLGTINNQAILDSPWQKYLLTQSETNNLLKISIINSQLINAELQNWIDNLVKKYYQVKDNCIVQSEKVLTNLYKNCRDTNWSSFSPDPKSDISLLLN